MSEALGYASSQHYPAVVTDRWGQSQTTLVNNGRMFTMVLRGNRFEGTSVDGLELVGAPADTDEPPTLHQGDLCSCTIQWRMPVQVSLADAGIMSAPLAARLVLGDPAPNHAIDSVGVTLQLHLPAGVVETTTPQGFMEDALMDLQRELPDGTRLLACISCAFSDYHPAGSGFIGSMACFRDCKDTYRAVAGKRDLFALWDKRSGFVQETFHCPDFEQRQSGTGYRG
ncbi:DUF6304 family protein [Kitasatospora sp. NPDC051853]|uniref:DUF6304 family protein n=1 Tax=Kitasatospora sp. NPDC051853 TaxID=3364058 RepID=UPI0037886DE9